MGHGRKARCVAVPAAGVLVPWSPSQVQRARVLHRTLHAHAQAVRTTPSPPTHAPTCTPSPATHPHPRTHTPHHLAVNGPRVRHLPPPTQACTRCTHMRECGRLPVDGWQLLLLSLLLHPGVRERGAVGARQACRWGGWHWPGAEHPLPVVFLFFGGGGLQAWCAAHMQA